jgi:aminocarboxymuconate-semialdehyde decarboxylase
MAKAAKKRKKMVAKKVARAPAKKTTRTPSKKTASAKARPARSQRPAPKPVVIDFHAHIVVPEVLDFAYEHSLFAQSVAGKGEGGRPAALGEEFRTRMTDMTQRLKDMDQMGVDIQVISPSILQQCTYFAEPDAALKMERLGNERVAEAVAQRPDRLVGLGSVPMQDAGLAAQELERCVKNLGLKGVIISSHVNGVELGDERFKPFWAKAEQLGTAIFIHPAGSPDPRLRKHRQLITLGQPLEEAFAMSSLLYEGVMDEFPRLKIVFAHGGGFLPFYTGRHDNDYRNARHPTKLKGNFTSYLPRFYYDTVLFNPDMLEFLASKVPVSHLFMASDYPFAEKRPVEYVRRASKISRKDQDAILGANCAKVLGISI